MGHGKNETRIDLVNPANGEKFKIFFETEGLSFPQQKMNNIGVGVVSPLSLIQSKDVYAQIGSAQSRDKDQQVKIQLIDKFFPNPNPEDRSYYNDPKFRPEIEKVQ